MAAGVAELLLQLIERGLTVLDGVPHSLPRDAEVLGNFGQGQILIIVFCQDDALLVRQDRTVEVQQDGVGKVFLRLAGPARAPFAACEGRVKYFSLHQLLNYNRRRRKSQGVRADFVPISCDFLRKSADLPQRPLQHCPTIFCQTRGKPCRTML